ncbi:MAG: hypothetical protein ABSC77_07880 [Terracidiphilus sp.]|jgi:hypothetical protein
MQTYKALYFEGTKYPTEASVRKALQHTIQIKNEESSQAYAPGWFFGETQPGAGNTATSASTSAPG